MTFNKEKYDAILGDGLCAGLNDYSRGLVCIEAAIAIASGEPLNDHPACVYNRLSGLSIKLNDSNWSSPEARATGLYKLGLAQLGTRHITPPDLDYFDLYLANKIITQRVLPVLKEKYAKQTTEQLLQKLQEPDACMKLEVISQYCEPVVGNFLGRVYNLLSTCDYINAVASVNREITGYSICNDSDLRFLADTLVEAIEAAGHSNEFDSIWKKEKKDEV
jgi:hypothetical protein